MLVDEIILKMRSRLNDKDSTKYRWGDEELIDMINSSLSDLSIELSLFTHEKTITIEENQNRYELPHNWVETIAINIDDQPVTIKSFKWMKQNKNIIDNDNFLGCMDEQSFFLYPESMLKAGMKVVLDYEFIEQIEEKEDDIPISLMAGKALLYHSMHLALQINTNDKNRDRSTHYLRLYDKEIEKISKKYAKNRHSKKIKSKFTKV